jgi:predicted dehydrogenase
MSEPRIGVVGLRRGLQLARHCASAGLRVTAVCDTDAALAESAARELGARSCPDFARLLEGPIDAVILANFFDEHAPLARQALAAGKHVLSETAACTSLEEGAALIDAVERSGLTYMFGENYPFKPHAFEIARRFAAGEIGAFEYAECEYYHAFAPGDFARFAPDRGHWRGRISSTHYCTHSIAPVMAITGRFPVAVSAFEIGASESGRGRAVVEMVRFDDGALLKSLHGFLQGEPPFQWSFLRLHGSRGLLENARRGDARRVRLRREAWASGSGETEDVWIDPPDVPDDLRMLRAFADALTGAAKPRLDVRFGVSCSLVGVYALESLRVGSARVEMPNFGTRRGVE